MRTESASELGPSARTANIVPAHGHVVSQGVRHVAIDILPRDVLTFRTICGRDVTEDERPHGEATDCEWCRRFEGGSNAPDGEPLALNRRS